MFQIDDQLKVPIDTMIITATRAAIGILATHSPMKTISQQQEDAGAQRRQTPAATRLHVDHRLADHRAARHPADETGRDIRDALADAFAILVRRWH